MSNSLKQLKLEPKQSIISSDGASIQLSSIQRGDTDFSGMELEEGDNTNKIGELKQIRRSPRKVRRIVSSDIDAKMVLTPGLSTQLTFVGTPPGLDDEEEVDPKFTNRSSNGEESMYHRLEDPPGSQQFNVSHRSATTSNRRTLVSGISAPMIVIGSQDDALNPESIPVEMDDVNHKKSEELETSEKEANEALEVFKDRQSLDILRLILFIICLCCFVSLGFKQRGDADSDAYFQNNVPKRILISTPFNDSTGSQITFDQISSIRNMHDFFIEVLFPYVYRNTDFLYWPFFKEDSQREIYETNLGFTNGPQLYVLGGIRMRQVRYQYASGCDAEVSKFGFEECIDRKQTDDPIYVVIGGENITIEYETRAQLHEQYRFQGYSKRFYGHGHRWEFPVLSNNTTESDIEAELLAQSQLKDLFDSGFITELTRGLFIDFNLFNPTTKLHTLSRLLFEIHPAGGVIPYYSFNTWDFLRYWNPNPSSQFIIVGLYLVTLILLLDHLHHLYLFCKNGYWPTWLPIIWNCFTCCSWCEELKQPNENDNTRRAPSYRSLGRSERAKILVITGIDVDDSEFDRDKLESCIENHLIKRQQEGEGEGSIIEGFSVLRMDTVNNYSCCKSCYADDRHKWCACPCKLETVASYFETGVRITISSGDYDSPYSKKDLENHLRKESGFEKARIRGADGMEILNCCGFCKKVCGTGGEAFYYYSFWNKLDIFIILSLIVQCILHVVQIFILKDSEEMLLDRSRYHSLREAHNRLVFENAIFFMNGFLIPLKILQYCTDLTEDFRWFKEFASIAFGQIITFIMVLFVFLIAFSICGWLSFSADVYDFRHPVAAFTNNLRYVFVGPDYVELENSSNISGVLYYIVWYLVMSLILAPLLIAIFVNLALKVEEWLRSTNQKSTEMVNDNTITFKFRRPRPIDLTKKWFENPFPDCHKIIKEEIDKLEKNDLTEVNIIQAREIYRRIKNKTSSQDADLNETLQDQMKELRDLIRELKEERGDMGLNEVRQIFF